MITARTSSATISSSPAAWHGDVLVAGHCEDKHRRVRLDVESIERPPQPSPSLWRAIRADPAHAADVSVLYALPQLAPHVARWWQARQQRHPSKDPDALARRVVWRAAGVARRGGIITGSSFYVGMAPAMAMIYFEQLALVLRVAAVYGRDPLAPERAPEVLVLQGRYPSVSEAAAALRSARHPSPARPLASETRTLAQLVRQVPSMIGLRTRRLSNRSIFDLVVYGLEVVSFIVPVVSMPVWAFANASATRRLGRAAMEFYRRGPAPGTAPSLTLPPRPPRRTRRLFIATVVPLALTLGALVTLLFGATYKPGLGWVVLALGEGSLALTFIRLVRITRVETPA